MAADLAHLAPSRPKVHLSPPTGWMNDPNGLVYHGGRWHAYYQHDPNSDTHGSMHWGHASSTDLINWHHHPIALHPDTLGAIFSGSIVIDAHNTAGFGAGALVAVFTHSLHGHQHQSLAYSLDGGLTFQKYAHNPVLKGGLRDFRDPKVTRWEHGWLMVLAVGDRVEFYRSDNLMSWELFHSYSVPDPSWGVCECPDLFEVPLADGAFAHNQSRNGETGEVGAGSELWAGSELRAGGESRWVLTFCPGMGGPHGHGGVMYVPGSLDDSGFVPAAEPRRVDHGPDFYAMQSFHAAPDGRAVAMSWTSSWRYSNTHPSEGRRGMQSFPRQLTLDSQLRLLCRPAVDLHACSTPHPDSVWTARPDQALNITAVGDTTVEIVNQTETVATVNIADGAASITRHSPDFEGHPQHYATQFEAPTLTNAANQGEPQRPQSAQPSREPQTRQGNHQFSEHQAPEHQAHEHQVIVDHGLVEVFAGGGRATLSALVFPGRDWWVRTSGNTKLSVL